MPPPEWKPRELLYKKNTNKAGTRVTQSMKGGIKALFHDEAKGGASNRVFLDIYRKDAIADIRIAECELKATKKRRWAKVNVNNQLVNLGTAQYVLDIAESKFPEDAGKNKLTRKIGLWVSIWPRRAFRRACRNCKRVTTPDSVVRSTELFSILHNLCSIPFIGSGAHSIIGTPAHEDRSTPTQFERNSSRSQALS
jgi:hypothetical protein